MNKQSSLPKIPLLLSLIFFCAFLFAFCYFYRIVNNVHNDIQTKEEEWLKETKRRDEIKMLDNSVKIIEKERAQLDTHFAQSSDAVPFLDTIEKLAPIVGAKAEVTSVDIDKNSIALLVGMKASGTFSSLYKFLTLLENSPYELEFVGVDIHREVTGDTAGKKAKVSNWEAVFKLKLLSFVE